MQFNVIALLAMIGAAAATETVTVYACSSTAAASTSLATSAATSSVVGAASATGHASGTGVVSSPSSTGSPISYATGAASNVQASLFGAVVAGGLALLI